MSDDLINEILVPSEVIYPKKEISVSEKNENIEYAKENIKVLIETGTGALQELSNLALQSEHPRAYEALSTLIKNLSDMNKTIVDIEEAEIKRKSVKEQPKNVMNNKNVFIGTSKELLEEILKGEK